MMASSYDHNERHFRFQRTHTGELETTPPLKPVWKDIAAGAGIFIFIGVTLFFGCLL